VDAGWGSAVESPALVLDAAGTEVTVQLLESTDLPHHWARLDDLEGTGYQRVVARIHTEAGDVACIYVLAPGVEPEQVTSPQAD
jgi:gamma-glutamylcyclotransferase (GGCT)/AIG2-like uncharacterized protein YtfP